MAGLEELDEKSVKKLLNLKIDPETFDKLSTEEQKLLRALEDIEKPNNLDPSANTSLSEGASGDVPPPSPDMPVQGKVLGNIKVLTRHGWAAFPPKSKTPLKSPVDYVRLTWEDLSKYGGTLEESLRKCQLHHMSRGMPDIAYNFLVDGSVVIEGRGWDTDPDRPDKFGPALKGNCLDIAYVGNEKDYPDKEPALDMYALSAHLIDIGVNQKFINPKYTLIPHE